MKGPAIKKSELVELFSQALIGMLDLKVEDRIEDPAKDRPRQVQKLMEQILDGQVEHGLLTRDEGGFRLKSREKLLKILSKRLSSSDWWAEDVPGATEAASAAEAASTLAASDRGKDGLLFMSDFAELSADRASPFPMAEAEDALIKLGFRRVFIRRAEKVTRIGFAGRDTKLEDASRIEFGPGHVVEPDRETIEVLKHTDALTRPRTREKPGKRESLIDSAGTAAIAEYASSRESVTTKEVVKNALMVEDSGPGAPINKEVAAVLRKIGFIPEIVRVNGKETKRFSKIAAREKRMNRAEEDATQAASESTEGDETESNPEDGVKEEQPVEEPGNTEQVAVAVAVAAVEIPTRVDLDDLCADWRMKLYDFVRDKDFTLFEEVAIRAFGRSPNEFDRYHMHQVSRHLGELGFSGLRNSALRKMVYVRGKSGPKTSEAQAVLDSLTESAMAELVGSRQFPDGITDREKMDVIALEDALMALVDGEVHSRRTLFRNHFDAEWQLRVIESLIRDGLITKQGNRIHTSYRGIPEKLSDMMDQDLILALARKARDHGKRPDGPEERSVDTDDDREASGDSDDRATPGDPADGDELKTLVAGMFEVLREHTDTIKALKKRIRRLEEASGVGPPKAQE